LIFLAKAIADNAEEMDQKTGRVGLSALRSRSQFYVIAEKKRPCAPQQHYFPFLSTPASPAGHAKFDALAEAVRRQPTQLERFGRSAGEIPNLSRAVNRCVSIACTFVEGLYLSR
jgi:hypothetical protein